MRWTSRIAMDFGMNFGLFDCLVETLKKHTQACEGKMFHMEKPNRSQTLKNNKNQHRNVGLEALS